MIKDRINSLNDDGILIKGISFSVFFLIAVIMTLENVGVRTSSLIVYFVLSVLFTIWTSRCYSLLKETDFLFAPLLFVCGVLYALILPVTPDEIPVAGILSYGDGATFSRLFSLPSFWILKLLGADINTSVYFARFINLICCTVLVWFSVKIIPYCNTIAAAVCLLPASLRSFATAAPQGTTLATSLLFIALALRAAYTKDTYIITKKYLFALATATVLMLFCNISTLPFISLLFMIPVNRFGRRQRYLKFWLLVGISIIICILLWTFGAAIAVLGPVEGLSRSAQLTFILEHPLYYITVIFRTLFTDGMRVFSEFFYTVPLTSEIYSEIKLPWVISISLLMSLIYVCYFDSGLSPRREKIIRTTGISTLVFIAVQITFYYLAKTPLGNKTILGIDVGVFLPVILPSMMFVKRLCKHPAAPQKNFSESLMVMSLANLATLLMVYSSI